MEARMTERGGTSREGHTANRRRGWIGKRRSTGTQQAGCTARLMTAIAMFVVSMGMAGPAAADVLVSNLGQISLGSGPREKLAGQSYAMPFTTGTNDTGYVLDSISIKFENGSWPAGYPLGDPVGDPVYVYLYRDTGGGRPNHSSQVAVLTKAGTNFDIPVAGVNKYLTARANNLCCQRPHVLLEPETQYWVYIWAGSSTSEAQLDRTTLFEDAGGAPGWSIGDSGFIHPDGTTASAYTETGTSAQIQVEGKVNAPVTVSITDGSGTEGTDETIDFVVSLSGLTTETVSVLYTTVVVFGEATEDTDYEDTGGRLTFEPGETSKTISVPILDDTDVESNETFRVLLSGPENATVDQGTGTGTIINAAPVDISINSATATEGVDETMEFVATLSRSTTRTLSISYTTWDGTATAGVDYTETTGTLTVEPGETTKTISVPIIDDNVNDDGETFNILLTVKDGGGAYTITSGHGLGTIYNTEDLTASFENIPQDHDGTNTFTFNVQFTRHVSTTPAAMRDHAFTVTNGEVTAAAGVNSRDDQWVITVEPDGDDTVTITLPGNRDCATQGAICSDDDNPVQLTNSPSATVARSTGTPLTATFSNMPDEHTGADFTFDLAFTDELIAGWKQIKRAFVVSGGSIEKISRKTKGSDLGWNVTVRPAGTDSLTITLRATAQCSSTGAVCTDDGRRLSNSPSATVTGTASVVKTTPTVSIAGGSGKEGDDDAIDFTVTLGEGASGTVTVDYATSDGSAEAGDDYTAKSGTLSFSAGETSKTISVTIEDDIENESEETFTVTLSNASGADLGTASATGTIQNRHVAPLTATFSNVPAEHDGSEFTFDLAFSENVKAGYARIRDDALRATGATIEKARRKTQGSNQNWTITVEPLGSNQIAISLPATTDCDATGAICTDDGRKLSHSTSASVLGPVGISIGDVEVEEGAGVVLAFSVALTRAASSQLTVDYATSDGTATAGADYTATSGTLTIGAGSSSGTIQVSVIDDEHNEGSETFTVTLSNASSGDLTDSSATGTITNHDALPKALIARFGRTAAVHIVEQVEERVNAPRAPGFDGRIAGRESTATWGNSSRWTSCSSSAVDTGSSRANRAGR